MDRLTATLVSLAVLTSLGCTNSAELYDFDDDGTSDAEDCAPSDPNIYPGAEEVCNEIDDDCDGEFDEGFDRDMDGDGHDSEACLGQDCNDTDPTIYPGADETCDLQDNDCDGDTDEDFDPDVDYDGDDVPCSEDCDDSDPSNFPGNLENCDGADSDCFRKGACGAVGWNIGAYTGVTKTSSGCDTAYDQGANWQPILAGWGNCEGCAGDDASTMCPPSPSGAFIDGEVVW